MSGINARSVTYLTTVETPEPIRLYRLVIEPDEKTGTFIYKTVDRETGEVVRRYPREDLLRMREDPAYDAGVVAGEVAAAAGAAGTVEGDSGAGATDSALSVPVEPENKRLQKPAVGCVASVSG